MTLTRGVIIGVLFAAVACTGEPSPAVPASEVVRLWFHPIPEGVLGPEFAANPRPGKYEIDLRFVRDAIPDPLPEPSHKFPDECGYGMGVVIWLESGERLEYGTCDYPANFPGLGEAVREAYRDHWPKHVRWTPD